MEDPNIQNGAIIKLRNKNELSALRSALGSKQVEENNQAGPFQGPATSFGKRPWLNILVTWISNESLSFSMAEKKSSHGRAYARLERENDRLKRENTEILQHFVVWQYNAHIHGLSDRKLRKALPKIDRGETD